MVCANSFSLRDWVGVIVGISWGLVLSRFFAADNTTGPFLLILLGPPLVLLISPSHPILGWQLPVVTASLSGAFQARDPGETSGMVFVEAAMLWAACSIFSSPWALIFHHRAKRASPQTPTGPLAAYAGVALLTFLGCALLVVGFALTLYPGDFADPRNRAIPFYGLFMVTAGMALSVFTDLVARGLKIHRTVRAISELPMVVGAIIGITELVVDYVDRKPDSYDATSPDGRLCCAIAGLEALAGLIWLIRLERRERRTALETPQT